MTKTYFTTLVRNRETKRKEEKIVAGDMFKIKINDTIIYCGIYRPGKKREYYIVELNTGLSFGALYVGPKEKAIDSMLRELCKSQSFLDFTITYIEDNTQSFNSSNIETLKNKKLYAEVII